MKQITFISSRTCMWNRCIESNSLLFVHKENAAQLLHTIAASSYIYTMIHFKFIGSFLLFLATHFARNASDCAECVLNAFQISMEMCVCVCVRIFKMTWISVHLTKCAHLHTRTASLFVYVVPWMTNKNGEHKFRIVFIEMKCVTANRSDQKMSFNIQIFLIAFSIFHSNDLYFFALWLMRIIVVVVFFFFFLSVRLFFSHRSQAKSHSDRFIL